MNCLINLLAICVFDPSNVYVSASLAAPITEAHHDGEGHWCNDRWCPGPVGMAEIGVIVELPERLEVRYGIRHESMAFIFNDRGQEYLFAEVSWRPFR